jgi:hypothetical protein
MKLVSPLAMSRGGAHALARRRPDLRGARVGVLDNSKPNADALLGRVAELLVERARAGPVRVWRKPGSSLPATVIDEVVAQSDVVLTGSAD